MSTYSSFIFINLLKKKQYKFLNDYFKENSWSRHYLFSDNFFVLALVVHLSNNQTFCRHVEICLDRRNQEGLP